MAGQSGKAALASRGVLRRSGMSALLALAAMTGTLPVAQGHTPWRRIGLTQLRAAAPELNGTGITVAQVEASLCPHGDKFEPNCAATGQPSFKFTFINCSGTVGVKPDIRAQSAHATRVGWIFYGNRGGNVMTGVCPDVSHIDVWNAQALYRQLCRASPSLIPPGQIAAPAVINQSYVFEDAATVEIRSVDAVFDNYAARHNTLFISAIGNGLAMTTETGWPSQVNPPADAYNDLAVATCNGTTGIGPACDGRSKPDISAPGTETSYAAPLVSGAAALLLQAGKEGLGGSTTADTDIRVIKALLLNGATKPADWTNSYTIYKHVYIFNAPNAFTFTPLDPRYGSGVLNVYHAYEGLLAGEHSPTASTTLNGQSMPTAYTYAAAPQPLKGWNLGASNTRAGSNRLHHYLFVLPKTAGTSWNLTATLDWNVTWAGTTLLMDHFYLYLLNASGEVAWSKSPIDNVQQIHLNKLAPGTYDLVVMEHGSPVPIPRSHYALSWDFTPVYPGRRTLTDGRHR
ncbi:MAG: S8 family serine peptidase [Phycisphaerae bacterium]|nr:S8 family serine peptidase [Phycisphaerae bacterium]